MIAQLVQDVLKTSPLLLRWRVSSYQEFKVQPGKESGEELCCGSSFMHRALWEQEERKCFGSLVRGGDKLLTLHRHLGLSQWLSGEKRRLEMWNRVNRSPEEWKGMEHGKLFKITATAKQTATGLHRKTYLQNWAEAVESCTWNIMKTSLTWEM